MKCIYPKRKCSFRNSEGFCEWHCPNDAPGECDLADSFWSCPYVCLYEIIEHENGCPLRKIFQEKLDEIMKCGEKTYLESRKCLMKILER